MPNIRKTTEHFIQLAQKVHGTKYDYSKSIYTVSAARIVVTCPKHGDFEVQASKHTGGSGCKECARESHIARMKARPSVFPKMTQEQFIARCKESHGERYDYSKAVYKSWQDDKVCFICKEHGEFWQLPSSHILRSHGCPKCADIARSESKKKAAAARFVDMCKKATVYGSYSYDKVAYIDQRTPVVVTCVKHGDFEILPMAHKAGQGCKTCSAEFKSEQSRQQMLRQGLDSFLKLAKERFGDQFEYHTETYSGWQLGEIKITCKKHNNTFFTTPVSHLEFCMCDPCKRDSLRDLVMSPERCQEIHGGKYDYSEVSYVNCSTHVKIRCKKCNESWMTTPTAHIHGRAGCPKCTDSKGEKAIAAWLKKHEISFEPEWKPKGGVYGRRFLYDFYAQGVLIEFDGIQHSMPVEIFGGEEAFAKVQESDRLKTQWACENCIPLVRIGYRDIKKIGSILSDVFAGEKSNELLVLAT